ncbi:MAG: hypothetical protein HY744_25735 [Deltaproteobacteria bacterium]|nr:hypothetical protein [Deltaproteobacteria bacterium]
MLPAAAHGCDCETHPPVPAATSAAGGGQGGTAGAPAAGGGGGCPLGCGGQGGAAGSGSGGGCEPSSLLDLSPPWPAALDIIFAIDNSDGMTEHILAVQKSINGSFAQIVEKAAVSYRVIMVTAHGNAEVDQSVCIEAPLSSIPPGGCAPGNPNFPGQPGLNPPKFFHHSVEIGNHDAWCQLLATYDDWGPELRTEAFKAFVMFSDDGTLCQEGGQTYDDADPSAAQLFDKALLAKAPEQFGTAKKRNYLWHSIIGLVPNPINPGGVWLPSDPVLDVVCSTDPKVDCTAKDPPPSCLPAPGISYQWLSVDTHGLRFSLCGPDAVQGAFEAIAQDLLGKAFAPVCEFPCPDPGACQALTLGKFAKLIFDPGGGGAPVQLVLVDGPEQCASDSFYIDDQATADPSDDAIVLCDELCKHLAADPQGKIVLALCDCPCG